MLTLIPRPAHSRLSVVCFDASDSQSEASIESIDQSEAESPHMF